MHFIWRVPASVSQFSGILIQKVFYSQIPALLYSCQQFVHISHVIPSLQYFRCEYIKGICLQSHSVYIKMNVTVHVHVAGLICIFVYCGLYCVKYQDNKNGFVSSMKLLPPISLLLKEKDFK